MPLQDALPAAIRLCLGDPEADVIWKNREVGFRSDTHVKLSILRRPRRGVDEIRYSDPDVDGGMTERVYGVRRIQIQVEVETQDQDLAESAHEIAEQIRTGLMRTDVLEVLDASDLGGPQTTEPRQVDYWSDDRWTSAVVFEVWLNAHTSHTGALVPAVAAVEVSGDVDEGTLTIGPFTVDGEP